MANASNEEFVRVKYLRNYVTQSAMLEQELAIKNEIADANQKNLDKIERVSEKVEDLRTLVLPLISSSAATATNTEKLVVSLDKFIDKQSDTNDNIYGRISHHDVALAESKGKLEHLESSDSAKWKLRNTTKGIFISTVGLIIIALINLAPLLF